MSSSTACVLAITVAPASVNRVAPRLTMILGGAVVVLLELIVEGEFAWTSFRSPTTSRKPRARARRFVGLGGIPLEDLARTLHLCRIGARSCLKQGTVDCTHTAIAI